MEFFGTRNEVHKWMNRTLSNQGSEMDVDPLFDVVWLSTHLGGVSSSLFVPSPSYRVSCAFFPWQILAVVRWQLRYTNLIILEVRHSPSFARKSRINSILQNGEPVR